MRFKIPDFGIVAKILILSSSLILLMNLSLLYVLQKIEQGTVIVRDQASTFEILQMVNQTSVSMADMRYWLGDLATTMLNESEKNARDEKQKYEQALDRLSGKDAEVAASLKALGDEYFNVAIQAVDAYAQENRVLGNSLTAKARDLTKKIDEVIGGFMVKNGLDSEDAGKAAVSRVLSNSEEISRFGYLLIFVVTAIGTFLAFSLSNSITKPIRRIMNQLEEISVSNNDTSARLMESSQKGLVSVSQQAAAIQETVASMAEMSSMLEQTGRYSKNANDMATEVSHETGTGMVTMQKMASAMDVISSANSRLQDITRIIEDISARTNVINDIVFKTQLLSVNAAIEAARAGQHGKGFAVVANEVGNLASMSGKAANEIRTLLNDSKGQVSQIVGNTDESVRAGQAVSSEALRTFEKISKSMNVISERVNQINEATHEQESGIKQTSIAMNQMNEVTARNSAFARENATLSENLKQQSLRLHRIGKAMSFVVLGAKKKKKEKVVKMTVLDELLGGDGRSSDSVSANQGHEENKMNLHAVNTNSEKLENDSSSNEKKDSLISRLLKKADHLKMQANDKYRASSKDQGDNDTDRTNKSA